MINLATSPVMCSNARSLFGRLRVCMKNREQLVRWKETLNLDHQKVQSKASGSRIFAMTNKTKERSIQLHILLYVIVRVSGGDERRIGFSILIC